MLIKSNPSKKSGFTYFFRNNKKVIFIKKPGGRTYYKFPVPSRVKPLLFLDAVLFELAAREYFDYKFYYTKDGELTTRRAQADTIWIKKPKGKKFHPTKFPFKLTAKKADDLAQFLIQEDQKKKRTKARKKKEEKAAREEVTFEEDLEPEKASLIDYWYEQDQGFYKSRDYGITKFQSVKAYAIPQVKITKNNVNSFIDYVEGFGMSFVHSLLKEMKVKEGQSWRLRMMGAGNYEREIRRRGRVIKRTTDTFGFSLKREDYNEGGFDAFAEEFIGELQSKLTGAKSYLTRSQDGFLFFEGFHVEIYK